MVNDMASVNVDAELVRQGGGLVQQEEKMIELSNGVPSACFVSEMHASYLKFYSKS